jgi:hypothetical protein
MSAHYSTGVPLHGSATMEMRVWWFPHRNVGEAAPFFARTFGGTHVVDGGVPLPGVHIEPYGAVVDDFGDLVRVAKP